jgi:hypothetical protein
MMGAGRFDANATFDDEASRRCFYLSCTQMRLANSWTSQNLINFFGSIGVRRRVHHRKEIARIRKGRMGLSSCRLERIGREEAISAARGAVGDGDSCVEVGGHKGSGQHGCHCRQCSMVSSSITAA